MLRKSILLSKIKQVYYFAPTHLCRLSLNVTPPRLVDRRGLKKENTPSPETEVFTTYGGIKVKMFLLNAD